MLRRTTLPSSRRLMHLLQVPDYTVHSPCTSITKAGLPAEIVREVKPMEKFWSVWSTTDAYIPKQHFPSFLGFKYIPYGQVWVLTNGQVLKSGVHFLVPFVHRIKAIKTEHSIVTGVPTEPVKDKNGTASCGYVVYSYKVKDFKKSAFFEKETTATSIEADEQGEAKVTHENVLLSDSEKHLSTIVRKALAEQIPKVVASEEGLSAADSGVIKAKVEEAVKEKAEELGIELENVEVRGVFPWSYKVMERIRAMDPPMRDPDAAGHGLSNDYWADVLTPPFFEKNQFGSRKEHKTPATTNLVWSIPSPPDYHHFNQLPRIVDNPGTYAVAEKRT